MAWFSRLILFTTFLLLCSISISAVQKPKALILPVSKDATTLQYVTQVQQRTPHVLVKLIVDLGGTFLWVDCNNGYISSSYKPVHCGTPHCALARSGACAETCMAPAGPSCSNNTCVVNVENTIIHLSTFGNVIQDFLALPSTDGSKPGPIVTAPLFSFACGSEVGLEGLATGAKGMASLSRAKLALPNQLADIFKFDHKFAMCLPSSTSASSQGVIFFGSRRTPYVFQPGVDASKSLIYTPLLINPVSTAGSFFQGEKSYEYFIGVTSIKVNGKAVPLNSTLLSISKDGNGGTKVSTAHPYTVIESSIFQAVVGAFIRESGLTPVKPLAPFKHCFDSSKIGSTRVGPGVPSIDFVLQNESVAWKIFGANSMVKVAEKVLCLGFVDGGVEPRTSIVIGGHQLEDNLIEFDLARSRLGFSSSLLFRQTTCSNFNFEARA
ncbi:probable aspartic proteinase GIP2 [Typha angustifolia]|uniref:probable aspartic proteinase GIP2 n=1 Tax=Typha angustifolia TaxID=59011 RepID=UPI003C2ACF5E